MRIFSCALLLVMSMGCASTPAPVPKLTPKAERVVTLVGDAPKGSRELGLVKVVHGEGCGMSGKTGTKQGAFALLKLKAAAKGATHVRLDKTVEPGPRYDGDTCFNNEYIIEGTLYSDGSEDILD